MKFTLFAPERRDFLNIERSVSAINDVRGWDFKNIGRVQAFEQVERDAARRTADRFTDLNPCCATGCSPTGGCFA